MMNIIYVNETSWNKLCIHSSNYSLQILATLTYTRKFFTFSLAMNRVKKFVDL